MEIVISDTNIFIDLWNIGLLKRFCELPLSIHTTDFSKRPKMSQRPYLRAFCKVRKSHF